MVTVFGTSKEINDVIRHYTPGHPNINFDSIAWNPMMFYMNGVFVQVNIGEKVKKSDER